MAVEIVSDTELSAITNSSPTAPDKVNDRTSTATDDQFLDDVDPKEERQFVC